MIWRRWLSVVGFGIVSVFGAPGQDKPVRLVYEVASIKASPPGAPEGYVDPLPGGIGYNAKNIPVKDMLSVMYRIPRRQIVGGPEWLSSERFDIQVRADHPYSIDDLHIMFQNLLADRFNLKLHIETKAGPVYMLTIAKSGLKMNPVDAGKDRNIPITDGANHEYIGSRVPVNYLCFWLGQKLQNDQRPVVDGTGLTGTYDFKLTFRPQLPPDASMEGSSPELDSLPSIFNAVKDQLGLELTPERGPVETLVIDHIEKPSEN
jgi:uncharacterized protein (TIGR03435 family)